MDKKEEQQAVVEVIAYLNMRTKSFYRPAAATTARPVLARVHEGFTVQDMKDVINTMAAKWMGNETMERYLRPSTLFGTKFDSYLQEARRHPQQSRTNPAGKSGFKRGLLDVGNE